MSSDDRPTFKELYEGQSNKISDIEKRLGRMEKGFLVLTMVIASPKLGGPDASHIVSELVNTYLASIM